MSRFRVDGYGYDTERELPKLDVLSLNRAKSIRPEFTALGSETDNRSQFAVRDKDGSIVHTFHHYCGAVFFVQQLIEKEALVINTLTGAAVVELTAEEVERLEVVRHHLREAVDFEC